MLQAFGKDKTLMDTLDGEVRADVEAAARLLSKRVAARCVLKNCRGAKHQSRFPKWVDADANGSCCPSAWLPGVHDLGESADCMQLLGSIDGQGSHNNCILHACGAAFIAELTVNAVMELAVVMLKSVGPISDMVSALCCAAVLHRTTRTHRQRTPSPRQLRRRLQRCR